METLKPLQSAAVQSFFFSFPPFCPFLLLVPTSLQVSGRCLNGPTRTCAVILSPCESTADRHPTQRPASALTKSNFKVKTVKLETENKGSREADRPVIYLWKSS